MPINRRPSHQTQLACVFPAHGAPLVPTVNGALDLEQRIKARSYNLAAHQPWLENRKNSRCPAQPGAFVWRDYGWGTP